MPGCSSPKPRYPLQAKRIARRATEAANLSDGLASRIRSYDLKPSGWNFLGHPERGSGATICTNVRRPRPNLEASRLFLILAAGRKLVRSAGTRGAEEHFAPVREC